MESDITIKDSFCELCQIKFNNKCVYDIHVSVMHGGNVNKVSDKTEKIVLSFENEKPSTSQNVLHSDIAKESVSSENILNIPDGNI